MYQKRSKNLSRYFNFISLMGRNWTASEDDLLRDMISQYGKQWSVIASQFPNRSATQIAARWEKCINPKLHKGQFREEEDLAIIEFVENNGVHAWPKITSVLPNRTPKQCRERWFNNLDPNVVKTPWTPEEDELIFKNFIDIGTKWSVIAQLIPGRTDNSIKNRFNASISKRMREGTNGNFELLPCKPRKQRTPKPVPKARPPPIDTSFETITPPTSPPMVEDSCMVIELPSPNFINTPFNLDNLEHIFSPVDNFNSCFDEGCLLTPTGLAFDMFSL